MTFVGKQFSKTFCVGMKQKSNAWCAMQGSIWSTTKFQLDKNAFIKNLDFPWTVSIFCKNDGCFSFAIGD